MAIVRGASAAKPLSPAAGGAIEKGWVFQPGDGDLGPAGRRARPACIVSRAGATGSGVACWTVASDSRRDITLISTVLKKDLAQLNAGQDIERRSSRRRESRREAERAVTSRHYRRGAHGARAGLGAAAVDWPTAFVVSETLVSRPWARTRRSELRAREDRGRGRPRAHGEAFLACRADADDCVAESLQI